MLMDGNPPVQSEVQSLHLQSCKVFGKLMVYVQPKRYPYIINSAAMNQTWSLG